MNKEKTLTPEEIWINRNPSCDGDYCFGHSTAMMCMRDYGQQEYNRGKTEAQQWISVDEELPELTEPSTWFNDETQQREVRKENTHATVQAYHSELGYIKAVYDGIRWCEIATRYVGGITPPIWWQPLPSAPTQGKEKDDH